MEQQHQTSPGDRAERIRAALEARFAPSSLLVVDDSAKHAGHAGAQAGGETHYTVTITAAEFDGRNRVARHRLVHEALSREFETGLHALSVKAISLNETISQR